MDELKALRTFLTAAEKRNFAQAAKKLDVTPASVTRTIAALEAELGVQLFVRTTRQVSLTNDGAVFAARIEPAMEAFDNARAELMAAHKADEGRIRINAPMSLGQRVLAQILCGFRSIYPKIKLEISLTDELLDMIDEDFDLAVRISEPPSDKFTIWRKICAVRRVMVAAPGTTFAMISHPKEIAAEACFGYSSESGPELWQLSNAGTNHTIIAGSCVSSNNGEVLARMAADGNGVALLPTFIVSEFLAAGQLITILPDWQPPQLWLTLYYPPYQKLPPRIAVFSEYFEKNITSLVTAIG
ncbi:LysR substrate-binding domain-containing protein [Brucella cytisi]|jgi:DNA-binding transcriptional LysR family regulator|uniref:LysR family transcriptional regulator n=1 Tax=Brucella cytisi TaxID=407152 RepID=UPI00313C8C0C